MHEAWLGNNVVQVRPAFGRHQDRVQHQAGNVRDAYYRNPGEPSNTRLQQSNQLTRKGDPPPMYTPVNGNETIDTPNQDPNAVSEMTKLAILTPTTPYQEKVKSRDFVTLETPTQQRSRKRNIPSRSKDGYSRHSSSTPKRNQNAATDLTPVRKKYKNPSKIKRNEKANSSQEIESETIRAVLSDAPKVNLSAEQKSDCMELISAGSGNEPAACSHHQQLSDESRPTKSQLAHSPKQECNNPKNPTQFLIKGMENPSTTDQKSLDVTVSEISENQINTQARTDIQDEHTTIEISRSSTMTITQSERSRSSTSISDPISPQPDSLKRSMSESQVCMNPLTRLESLPHTNDAFFGDQKNSRTPTPRFDLSESIARSLGEQATNIEGNTCIDRSVSQKPELSSDMSGAHMEEVSKVVIINPSVSPKSPTKNESDTSVNQTDMKALAISTDLEREPTMSTTATFSPDLSPCSGRIQGIEPLSQQKSKAFPKPDIFTLPSAAIVTHKKKKKSFPSNSSPGDLRIVNVYMNLETLDPINVIDQGSKISDSGNVAESSLCISNTRKTKSALPGPIIVDSITNQDSGDNHIKDGLEQPSLNSALKSNQTSKPMSNRMNKLRRKAKHKSKKIILEHPAIVKGDSITTNPTYPNTHLPKPEEPYSVNNENENEDALESTDPYANAEFRKKILPKPEMPYLVNNKHLTPCINSHAETEFTAINPSKLEPQHLINGKCVITSVGPQTEAEFIQINIPEAETQYSANHESMFPPIEPRTTPPQTPRLDVGEKIGLSFDCIARIDSGIETEPIGICLEVEKYMNSERHYLFRISNFTEYSMQENVTDSHSIQQKNLDGVGIGIQEHQKPIVFSRSSDASLAPEPKSDQGLAVENSDIETDERRSRQNLVNQETISSQEQVIANTTPGILKSVDSEKEPSPELDNSLHISCSTLLPSSSVEPKFGDSGHIEEETFNTINTRGEENDASHEAARCASLQAQGCISSPCITVQSSSFPSEDTSVVVDKDMQQLQSRSEMAGSGKPGSTSTNTAFGAVLSGKINYDVIADGAQMPKKKRDAWVLPCGEHVWGKSSRPE